MPNHPLGTLRAECFPGFRPLLMAALLALVTGPSLHSQPTPEPYRWRSVTLVAGGYVPGIIFSPAKAGVIYCRTDIGGGYRWDADTQQWYPLTDWVGPADFNLLGCESIAPDPTDAAKLYVAAGMYVNNADAAILRSSDGGRTFKLTKVPFAMGGNNDGRSVGERLAVDPNSPNILYFGSRQNGLWKSLDGAVTWTQVTGFPVRGGRGGGGRGGSGGGTGLSFVVFDPRAGQHGTPTNSIYVGQAEGAGNHLYHSADAGTTWQAVTGQPPALMAEEGAIDSQGVLYVTYANVAGPNGATSGAVWKLKTDTGQWTNITPPMRGSGGFCGLSLDRQHPGTLIAATLDHWSPVDDIYRSTDGGGTWKSIQQSARMDASLSPYLIQLSNQDPPKFGWWISATAIDPFDSNHMLYGTGATIYGTHDLTNLDHDQPTHFSSLAAKGIEETAVLALISPPDGPHLIAGVGDIGGYTFDRLDVSPATMHLNPKYTNETSLDYAELDPKVVVRTGTGAAGYSEDGGHHWVPINRGGAATAGGGRRGGGGGGGGGYVLSSDGTSLLATGGAVAISKDKGATWTPVTGLPAGVTPVADRASPTRFYGLDQAGGQMFVSSDGGTTFAAHPVTGLPAGGGGGGRRGGGGSGGLKSTPAIAGDLLVAAGRSLYHSTDGGSTFAQVATGANISRLGFGKAPPGKNYPALFMAGTANNRQGVFRSDDGGVSWIWLYDQQHQFGGLPTVIAGDPRVFGRVYIGLNGRGILYGEPASTPDTE